MPHVPALGIFRGAPALSALLLLQYMLLVPAGGAELPEKTAYPAPASLNCSNPGTELCIRELIDDELIPLQDFVANVSELLILADQLFVERVWAFVQGSVKEPIAGVTRQLTDMEQTFSRLHVTWNLNHQKVNALVINLTQTQASVEGGVGLLEEVMALLQHHMELNISTAIRLSGRSEELLRAICDNLKVLYEVKLELNSTLHLVKNSVSHIKINEVDMGNVSTPIDVLEKAVKQFKLEIITFQHVQNVTKRLSSLTDGFEKLRGVLEESKAVEELGKLTSLRVNETAVNILKDLAKLKELGSSVEIITVTIERVVRDVSETITAARQLIQNVSRDVTASVRILDSYAVLKERLPALQTGANAAIQHALLLFQQVQTITQRGERFVSSEFKDEYDRLSVINATVSRAVVVVSGASLQVHTLSVTGLVNSAEDTETRAVLLQQLARNTTAPPLSVLVYQFKNGWMQYKGLHATYLDALQKVTSFEQDHSAISGELLALMTQLNLIRNRIDSANETLCSVFTLLENADSSDMVASILSKSIGFLEQAINNSIQVSIKQESLGAKLLNLSVDVQDGADNQSSLNDMLSKISAVVSATYTITDQIDLPLEFGSDRTPVIAVGSDGGLFSPATGEEFRSLSLHFSPNNMSDSVIMHTISSIGNRTRTELIVEIYDAHLRVSLIDIARNGQKRSLLLTVPERMLEINRTYSVFVSRTGVNVRVELTDLQSLEVFSVHREASGRLSTALSAPSFLTTMTLHAGGSPPLAQGESNFSGCLSSLGINGRHINLWSLAVNSGQLKLHTCSMNQLLSGDSGKLQLSLSGGQYAQQWVNGSFLPAVVEFQTQLPNGLILYTHSQSAEPVLNYFSVYLELGRIEVRVVAGERQRTLTSSLAYHNGALHTIEVDLEGSRLVLRTEREVVSKRLQEATIASLLTYGELLVGGVREKLREEEGVDESNFTGCVSVLSMSSVLKVPSCYEEEIFECSYCSPLETVFAADFYGTSYAQFPTFSASEYLDISLTFRTYFADSLVLFIGSASEGTWLAMAMIGGRFHLLFQASPNTPLSISAGRNLHEGRAHTVTVIRSGTSLFQSLSLKVDDNGVQSPFGSSFPFGQFSSDLFIGGIARSNISLLYAGALWDGFKGRLDHIRINGKILDFSENIGSEEMTLVEENTEIQGQNGQDFYFNGLSSFAEFDIGRFPDNFSLGFQFNAEAESGLLFYVFSRRREDKMAIQLNHTTLQLYVLESVSGLEETVSVSPPVALREWHDVKVTQEGGNITVTLDGNLNRQETVTLPTGLRTTSPLYIGGLPSDQRIPISSGVVSDHFRGCMRTHYLSLATSRHGVEMSSCEGLL